MVIQLHSLRKRTLELEALGDTLSEGYTSVKYLFERLERQVGDWTESIDYSSEEYKLLPDAILNAASENNVQAILDWLGPPPVEKMRIYARTLIA